MVDFDINWDPENNFIVNILKKYYDIVISNDPEYLFYSCFGYEWTKYDCIRIFLIGENIRPDFNCCDYAIGFDYMKYEDRYLRYPLYMIYTQDYRLASQKHIVEKGFLETKTNFCSFVYSNPNSQSPRDELFKVLSQYRQVDAGGKCFNNIGYTVNNKVEWQNKYKFSFAFENSKYNGYTTEKIIQAFASRTIPLYWGNERIVEEFNPKSFVNCNDKSIEEVVDIVKNIDKNDEEYLNIIRQPIFVDGKCPQNINEEIALSFVRHIFDQDYCEAKRRSSYFWTRQHEKSFLIYRVYSNLSLSVKKLLKKK